jgi:hypothetical protein
LTAVKKFPDSVDACSTGIEFVSEKATESLTGISERRVGRDRIRKVDFVSKLGHEFVGFAQRIVFEIFGDLYFQKRDNCLNCSVFLLESDGIQSERLKRLFLFCSSLTDIDLTEKKGQRPTMHHTLWRG